MFGSKKWENWSFCNSTKKPHKHKRERPTLHLFYCAVKQVYEANKAAASLEDNPQSLKRQIPWILPNLSQIPPRPADTDEKISQSWWASFEMLLSSCTLDCPKEQQPYTTGEDLILPSATDMCKTMYGNDIDINKLKTVPLLDTTIARRIDKMASGVRVQLIEKLRLADAFALELDESTDVSKDA